MKVFISHMWMRIRKSCSEMNKGIETEGFCVCLRLCVCVCGCLGMPLCTTDLTLLSLFLDTWDTLMTSYPLAPFHHVLTMQHTLSQTETTHPMF